MTGGCCRRSLFLSRVLVTAALLGMAARAYGGAGIATDGSLGVAGRTIAPANAGGGNFLIPQSDGRVAGNNLFHSFSRFNIDTGQTATFTTRTAALANVISRVSGGSASYLYGKLALTPAAGSTPAFFFLNPAGVLFGAGATIDVPGAFHVSTADYVKFANGDKFHADLRQASTLSSAAPEAFGFLGTTRTPIVIKDGAVLMTSFSQPISLVAGDIGISNGAVFTPGGDIRTVALGKTAQEIGFTGALPAASGDLILNNGLIASPASGSIDGGVTAVSAGSILLVHGSSISSDTYSAGNAGTVTVKGGSIAIGNQGGIGSQANRGSKGNAGNVEVTAVGSLSLDNGGQISSSTFSRGDAGSVKVSAGSIAIGNQATNLVTGIYSQATSDSTGGKAGTVDVTAKGALSIDHGGEIDSSTFSTGNAGNVTVNAASIAIGNQGNGGAIRSQANDASKGNAGNVDVTTNGLLSIDHGGEISSSTFSSGNAGKVTVTVGNIAIDNGGRHLQPSLRQHGQRR